MVKKIPKGTRSLGKVGQNVYNSCIMKKFKQLTVERRYQISALLQRGSTQKQIAGIVGVSESTISRELSRNKAKRGKYSAARAQMLADERKERFKRKRSFSSSMQRFIDKKLREEQWSPEQINGYCKVNGIEMVSVERIYQHIRKDKAQGGDLYTFLRHKLKHRRRPVSDTRVHIKDRVGIEHRPAIVDQKKRFGDLEIDTVIGKDGKGAILTIVERTKAFVLMGKLEKGKNAEAVKETVIRLLMPYKGKIHTITSDNGKEFAEHKAIASALDIDFYFANPYSSWERGLNEYTNKLVRQYIPKGTDFNDVNSEKVKEIQYKLNRRPRKKLNYKTPAQLFFASLENKIAFAS